MRGPNTPQRSSSHRDHPNLRRGTRQSRPSRATCGTHYDWAGIGTTVVTSPAICRTLKTADPNTHGAAWVGGVHRLHDQSGVVAPDPLPVKSLVVV